MEQPVGVAQVKHLVQIDDVASGNLHKAGFVRQ